MRLEDYLAAVLLAVWLLGIIGFTAAVVTYGPADPNIQAALDTDPVGFLLVMTLCIVVWPLFLASVYYRDWSQTGPRRR
jgi:hypothetical protein